MLKNMLYALHYAKLFLILQYYALHKICMSLNTGGQNIYIKCLFAELHFAFKHRRGSGASQGRSPKKERKGGCCKLLSSHYFSTIRGERERLRERETDGEKEKRMRGSLGKVRTNG